MPGVSAATLKDLAAPTPPEEVRQRQGARQHSGQCDKPCRQPHMMLDYIDARFVYDRLDTVVGPENWQDRYENCTFPNSVRGGIGVLVDMGDGSSQWVWKWDVGVASDIEPEKGAHSEALKRAAVHFGIARDLYARGERQAPAPQYQQDAQPQQRPPVVQRAAQQPQPQVAGQQMQSPWACPMHGQFKVVPGGVSKRTGAAYDAFFSCTVQGCDQKPPRGLAVPPHMLQQQQAQQFPPPQQFDNSSNYVAPDGSDLPF